MGGCINNPTSCSNGFKSCPSAGAPTNRSNGLEVPSRNTRKPLLSNPNTLSARPCKSSGRDLPAALTAKVQPANTNVQNRKEPS